MLYRVCFIYYTYYLLVDMDKIVDVLSWCPGVEAVSVMLIPKQRAIVPNIPHSLLGLRKAAVDLV
jgi:hypothetical protein